LIQRLQTVSLKDGRDVEIKVITGPEPDWTDRIAAFLGHKGEIWIWQIRASLDGVEGVECRYYIAFDGEKPVGNICTFERGGVGILGHVFTSPDCRRMGIARLLMDAVCPDFIQRGGKALYLGTGYDSPAYHIYRKRGFRSLYPGSGEMEWIARTDYQDDFLGAPGLEVHPLAWRHWPLIAPLVCAPEGDFILSLNNGIFRRGTTEGVFLNLLRDNMRGRNATSAAVNDAGAMIAFASVAPWKALSGRAAWTMLDLFFYPGRSDAGRAVLQAVLPRDGRIQAWIDAPSGERREVLREAGFREANRINAIMQDFNGNTLDCAIMERD